MFATNTTTLKLPIELPSGWVAEKSPLYGVIISAIGDAGGVSGHVTVNEDVRHYALGMSMVRRPQPGAEPRGRGWREQLYAAAVAELQKVIA